MEAANHPEVPPPTIMDRVQLGLEGFLRIWLGGKPEFLSEGLRRIGVELAAACNL